MATLKEFEDALRQHGMVNALAILEQLKKRDREKRSVSPARRVVGRKMTAELARTILDMHATTGMTQQEIAFKLGVNQGRVNEVIKRGKWLSNDPVAPEALSRDKAMERLAQRAKARRAPLPASPSRLPPRPQLTGTSAVSGPASRPPPRPGLSAHIASAELPLEQPDRVKLSQAEAPAAKMPLSRSGEPASSPIVSAQLAFLDL